jgi:hypothetical protein
MEFVRKINSDDFVIITNRLKADFNVVFYDAEEPSVMESFRIHTRVKDIRASYYKNGTLVIRGDPATPEYQHVLDVISSVLDYT